MLGPRVDRKVGLGDDHHAADPEGVELVKDHIDDGGLRAFGRLDEGTLDGLEVADGVGVAIEQLEQQVTSQRVQSMTLLAPPIYRTSIPATRSAAVVFTRGIFRRGPPKSLSMEGGGGVIASENVRSG